MLNQWAALCLFLCGCQYHSQWKYAHIPSQEKQCSRLIYTSDDPITGIDLEFLYSGEELIAYIQVHSQPLISEGDKKVAVRLTAGEKTATFLADFHTGKQRARLDSALLQQLITFLSEEENVTIELKGYKEIVESKKFEKTFKNLKKTPHPLPFYLPF